MAVSYTHLRAHETDTSLFVGQRQMCIRDRGKAFFLRHLPCFLNSLSPNIRAYNVVSGFKQNINGCLLYTSPSPRDGHLSIRRAASDVYKRQGEGLFSETSPVLPQQSFP